MKRFKWETLQRTTDAKWWQELTKFYFLLLVVKNVLRKWMT